jgi:hypothetical protein
MSDEKTSKAIEKENALTLLLLEERQLTCFMEHDIRQYGALSCDYHSWIDAIAKRRFEIQTSPE